MFTWLQLKSGVLHLRACVPVIPPPPPAAMQEIESFSPSCSGSLIISGPFRPLTAAGTRWLRTSWGTERLTPIKLLPTKEKTNFCCSFAWEKLRRLSTRVCRAPQGNSDKFPRLGRKDNFDPRACYSYLQSTWNNSRSPSVHTLIVHSRGQKYIYSYGWEERER